jgi:hypothetical protein
MRYFGLLCFVSALLADSTGLPPLPSSVVLPTPPQATVNTTYPVVTGQSWAIHTAADLSNVLAPMSTLACGDEVVLDSGVVYTGNFTLPKLACAQIPGAPIPCTLHVSLSVTNAATPSSQPVDVSLVLPGSICASGPPVQQKLLLRSSSMPADGTRVLQNQAAQMASIQTGNSTAVLSLAAGATWWYIAGLELTEKSGVTGVWNLINAAPQSGTIVFDRTLIHSNGTDQAVRGIYMDGAIGVIHSQVYGFANQSQDTQAALAVAEHVLPHRLERRRRYGDGRAAGHT